VRINRHELASLGPEQRRELLARVQQADPGEAGEVVAEIVAAVRERGDEAVAEYTRKLDGADLAAVGMTVTPEEFDRAEAELAADVKDAIRYAVENIRSHHEAQLPEPRWSKEIRPGVTSGERWTPIASAGLYVPRGKGSFPSVMAMLTVPATVAGVPRVVVCTPPDADGSVDRAALFAARLSGIDTVYRVGGAQAIAALAYGTESIARVEKIVGPGSRYVTLAKRLVYGQVDPGLPAGPSESIVLCDETADPEIAARELMVEAEHGPDSAALLVTSSPELADRVEAIVPDLAAKLPDWRREFVEAVLAGFGGIVVAPSFDEAIEFSNDYAPEHLHVIARDPFEVLDRLEHAGEVLLGETTSIAYGNYAIGLNAILPTGGFARGYSCVGVPDFMKRSSFALVSPEGVADVGRAAVSLARYEGFPAHAEAADYVRRRFGRDSS
jgi:histidinol dehydrogenase